MMAAYHARSFDCSGDLGRMTAFLAELRPPGLLGEYPSPADLNEELQDVMTQCCTRLWLDDQERLAAFASGTRWGSLVFECQPEALAELGDEIVDWGRTCLLRLRLSGELLAEPGAPLTLEANCGSDDPQRAALLVAHGFQPSGQRSLRLVRDLSEALPATSLPEGFKFRSLAGIEEAPAAVNLHRAAFGTTYLTVEDRLVWMRDPDYEPELDLVVEAPDGHLAGYTYCIIHPTETSANGQQEGMTDPVAVHPDYQGRGLARNMLLEGMRRLKERGAGLAVLGTDGENLAMQHAALAAGFQIVSEKTWYSKLIDPLKTTHSS
jgi:ribosomal protein S18 acetylase RimI-like enzyme